MVEISALINDGQSLVFQDIDGIEGLNNLPKDGKTVWINIEGLGNQSLLKQVAELFDLHPLILDDLKEISEQSKSVLYDDMVFVILRMLSYTAKTSEIKTEHLSIVLSKSIVITFQEGIEGDVFDAVRQRISKTKSNHLKSTPDSICYHLLHALIDNYANIIESTSDKIEELEELILENPSKSSIVQLHGLRSDLLIVKKAIVPMRDILFKLSMSTEEFITDDMKLYYKDLYNHAVHQVELIESARELAMGLQDLYLSSSTARMNEVMKVLTIITTIFIPLTFIAGVYGMNFKHMPELNWVYSYPIVLGIMVGLGIAMFIYFKIKKWF